MKHALQILCMIVIFGLPGFSYGDQCEEIQANPLTLQVALKEIDLPQQRVLVTLTATNEGDSTLFLPRLREGDFEKFAGWWAWGLSVVHLQEGQFWFLGPGSTQRRILMSCHQGRLTKEECNEYIFPTGLDILELLPGENLSVTINIAHMKKFSDEISEQNPSFRELYTIPGRYKVMAFFRTGPGTPDVYFWKGGWTCTAESNQLIIDITSDLVK